MYSKEITFENKKKRIIYITKAEKNDPEIIHKISEFKKQYDSVTIFISGDKNMETILKEMITDKAREIYS